MAFYGQRFYLDFLDTKTDKVPPNFTQEVSEALYDKYAKMIEEKAEQLAEMMVEDRMRNGECKKVICHSEKELWKIRTKGIQKDFDKLLEHLKSQDIDIKFDKPKVDGTAKETGKEVTNATLKNILNNVNKTSAPSVNTPNQRGLDQSTKLNFNSTESKV